MDVGKDSKIFSWRAGQKLKDYFFNAEFDFKIV